MRYFIAILGLVLALGALAFVKGSQFLSLVSFGKEAQRAGPPPEAVGTSKASEQSWEETLDAVGSVASSKGVGVSTEAPGVVTRINFQSGSLVKEGAILVELDTSVERAELVSARANEKLAVVSEERSEFLWRQGAVPKADYDASSSQLNAIRGRVQSLQAQLARKIVRAPFSGRLGIRQVNLGQYLNPGTPIVVLEAVDTVFVDFPLPQQRIAEVKVGMPVRVTQGPRQLFPGRHADARPVAPGRVEAIEPTVDASTRAMRIRASVPNEKEALRPGMFVDVELILPKKSAFVTIPATSIVHASYGDSVFIVEDKKPEDPGARTTADGKTIRVVRQQFVRTGRRLGDFVAILDGVQSGQEVVSTGAFKLRNGAPVVVTEAALPTPKLDPHPPNR